MTTIKTIHDVAKQVMTLNIISTYKSDVVSKMSTYSAKQHPITVVAFLSAYNSTCYERNKIIVTNTSTAIIYAR